MLSRIREHFDNLRYRISKNQINKKEIVDKDLKKFIGGGSSRIELIGPPEDLDLDERDKWIEEILILVKNKIKSNIDTFVPFKDSEVLLRESNGVIGVRMMRPINSDSFEDQVIFTGNKVFTFKEFLEQKIKSFDDIIELEKTVVLLL